MAADERVTMAADEGVTVAAGLEREARRKSLLGDLGRIGRVIESEEIMRIQNK